MLRLHLADEAATQALGAALAAAAPRAGWMALHGDLGAGKTTLVRALLRALGVAGRVVSPTYTLVEPYEIEGETGARRVAHYDLYRLNDPEELEWMGAREDFGGDTLCLVEWPERGEGVLPPPDLIVRLSHAQARRDALEGPLEDGGRDALLASASELGAVWLAEVKNELKKSNISSSLN